MDVMALRFELRDFARILDIHPGRVRGWVDRKLITPAVKGQGPGRRRQFDYNNVVDAVILLVIQETFGERSRFSTRLFLDTAQELLEFRATFQGYYLVLFQIGEFPLIPLVARNRAAAEAMTLEHAYEEEAELLREDSEDDLLVERRRVMGLRPRKVPGFWTKTIISLDWSHGEALRLIEERGAG